MQIWAMSPRNLQLPMAVLENENSWLGGWVNALMVAVLLTYTKLPEADTESSLLLTCCVGSGTCRALFPKEVQSPNYPWNGELEQKTQSSLHILKLHRAMDLSFPWQSLPFLGEWKMGKKRMTRSDRNLQRNLAGKFSAKSLCFQPQYMDPCICKQISLCWWMRRRIYFLAPTEARTTGEDTRKVSWAQTELHTGLQFLELQVTWRASSLWSISPWYVKASKTISAWRTCIEPALMFISSPYLSAFVPQAQHWYPVKDSWLCIKAGS